MKALLFIFFLITITQCSFAQETEAKIVDSLYKEDQFYAGISYNILGKKPSNFSQNGFSLGFHLGFIKDIPLNKDRNVGIGIGLGYSANSFNQNLQINKNVDGGYNYQLLGDVNTYSKNKFSEHLIELPIEFRWRTSNALKYDFWRIYTGFKLGYVVANTSKYVDATGTFKNSGINSFNEFQYGLTLCFGYNTWNFYAYYALNPIFSNEVTIDGQTLDMNAIKIGLMFYIL
ncbi:porin family protein [Gaetbulibacter sp. M235]|uniref:porin family protein n=1 Tax=Gaetbulibacter sp. M235 TaxID=3126510 RepID=UPI00374EC524